MSITSNFYCESFFSLHIGFVELVLDNLCVIVVSGDKSNVSGVWYVFHISDKSCFLLSIIKL
jgi:hypothetical protein